jgi:hypothetical protein
VEDHFQYFSPSAVWDLDFSRTTRRVFEPHDRFEYQTLLGLLNANAQAA